MEKLQKYVEQMQSNLDEIKKLLEPQQEKKGDANIIKSVAELILNNNHYFIPNYQRGYKWDEDNVNALLDDIAEFLEDDSDKKFYCMQPIIVLKDENTWRVLDRQQRLTTFYILCKYLGLDVKSSIEYETRKKENNNVGGKEFLEKIEVKKSYDEYEDNDASIDFYFMQKAINTMDKWFKQKNYLKEYIKELLRNNKTKKYIGCIWYEAQNNGSSEEDIFARVNSGKIPLTDAELIKARILNIKNFDSNTKATQTEIANEWDNIEYDLQNEEFFGFLVQNDKKYTNKIELLFEIYCKISQDYKENKQRSIFEFINKKLDENKKDENQKIEFWKEIKNIYLTLKFWFDSQEFYHLIGFLLAIGHDINDIYKISSNRTKDEFRNWSKEQIALKLFMDSGQSYKSFLDNLNSWDNLDNLDKDFKLLNNLSYNNDRQKTQNIILLFNIITYMNSNLKFSFKENVKWSLEHIHAQHDDVKKIKDEENRKKWIESALDAIDKNFTSSKNNAKGRILEDLKRYGDTIESIRQKLCPKKSPISEEGVFEEIANKIINQIQSNEAGNDIHDIGNLALLSCEDNASLGNNIFFAKINKIKELDRDGKFIPICTKNVFMKYYSKDMEKNNINWTKNDACNYRKEILKSIETFFKGQENEYKF